MPKPKKPVSDELDPLRQMCKEGRLFDVQLWIKAGRPLVLKKLPPPGRRRMAPLIIAIDRGFHSLVQVLIEGGMPLEADDYHALHYAVQTKRKDIVALLIQHGAKVKDVSMQTVIGTWDGEMVELFVSHGANLVKDMPIAWALINKIRTALGVLKKYVGQQPMLIKQAEVALRYYAARGDAKWVSLMLWAGADPWSVGPDDAPDNGSYLRELDEPKYHCSAVEHALVNKRLSILTLKNFLTGPDPTRPRSMKMMCKGWMLRDYTLIKLLLDRGHAPTQCKDKCSSLISGLLFEIGLLSQYDSLGAQELLSAIRLLLTKGARWSPKKADETKHARRSLLNKAPKHTIEFIEMIHEHKAARRRDVEELIAPRAMQMLIQKRSRKTFTLVAELPDDLDLATCPEPHASR